MTIAPTTPVAQTLPENQNGTRKSADRPQKVVGARPNWVGGLFGWFWLLVVLIPLYWMIITSFKTQANYYLTNPLVPPSDPSIDNYRMVLEAGFAKFFINSTIVAVGAVVPAVAVSFMAAYAIVRGGRGIFLRLTNGLFLMGLAVPLQATIIPVYLLLIRMNMYDSLGGLILPQIAFAIPLTVLILANFIRDVPKELFESMRLDGATEWGTMWRLAFPLVRPAVATVSIYNGLTIWNAFLLPLVLIQDPEKRTLPFALWNFMGQYGINVPAVMAAVVLTTLPIIVLYIVGRRQLVSGLTAGVGK
jgi:raffinose/stachyose/melibiose transport system permease protein